MANPLQPKVIEYLEVILDAYVTKVVAGSRSGEPDVIACVEGDYYAFEIKWKNDRPSKIQKLRINQIIDKGGKAYFIRSVDDLRDIFSNSKPPIKYDIKTSIVM